MIETILSAFALYHLSYLRLRHPQVTQGFQIRLTPYGILKVRKGAG